MKCDQEGVVAPPHLKGFGSGQLALVMCNNRSVIAQNWRLKASPTGSYA